MNTLRRRRLSVRVYLTGAVTVAVALGMIAVTAVAYRIQEKITLDRVYGTSAAIASEDAQRYAVLAARSGRGAVVSQALDRSGQQLNLSYGVYPIGRASDTSLCKAEGCFPVPAVARSAVNSGESFYGFGRGGELPVFVAAVPVPGTSLELVTLTDYSQQLEDLRALRNYLAVVDAVGLIAALIGGIVVALTISRPMRRAALAARQFTDGHLDTRVPIRGAAETADLAEAFNAMAEGLTDTLRDLRIAQTLQQRFVADVSHELRTPLAAMVAAAGAMDGQDAVVRDSAAQLLREQTARLHALVEDLLEISRHDAGQVQLRTEPIDLHALASDVVAAVTASAGTSITVEIVGDPVLDADALRLHTVLRNLVTNALQHGTPPVSIDIDGRHADFVMVTVTDYGPGVPHDLRDTIFERFTSGHAPHAGDNANTGLGLAIALENARLHHATLQLMPGRPTRFQLRLGRGTP